MRHQYVRGASRALSALVVAAVCLKCDVAAHAGFILIASDSANSTEDLGTFTGSIDYTANTSVTGTLIISLTNTSAAGNEGALTGLIFNFESADANASVALQSGTHPFLDTQGGNGAPFGGDFMAGAALGGSFLGGGSPNAGIHVGETGTFTFLVNASDAASLTAESVINGPYEFDFIVRFKGFANGGSDKVPATALVVPAPGAMGLMAMALVGLGRRRRSNSL